MPVYRFDELPDVRHNPDLSTAHGPTVRGERIFFGLRTKDAGTGSAPHHHPSEEFLYIISGRVRAEIAGEDLVYIYVKDTAWGLKGVPAGEQAGEQPPEDEKY